MNLKNIIYQFDQSIDSFKFEPVGNGLINTTLKITTDRNEYILQKINQEVFPNPQLICENLEILQNSIQFDQGLGDILIPIYRFLSGKTYHIDEKGDYWRIMPFKDHLVSYDVVEYTWQAKEAAKAFGRFIKLTNDIELSNFHDTIPNFHDGIHRIRNLNMAINRADNKRLQQARIAIDRVKSFSKIFELVHSISLPLRLTHNDTKISNVLFDPGLKKFKYVIDLDTVMGGVIMYDFGDMIRTYICTHSEKEADISKIGVNLNLFEVLCDGFLLETKGCICEAEKSNLVLSGQYMTLIMAVRFLIDYLCGDVYFSTNYTDENLTRCHNQLALLEILIGVEDKMQSIVAKHL